MGGLLFVISSAEPPVLQIRMRRVTICPASTCPKFMIPDGSQPPSAVSTVSWPIGAVVALAVNSTYSVPPFVQI